MALASLALLLTTAGCSSSSSEAPTTQVPETRQDSANTREDVRNCWVFLPSEARAALTLRSRGDGKVILLSPSSIPYPAIKNSEGMPAAVVSIMYRQQGAGAAREAIFVDVGGHRFLSVNGVARKETAWPTIERDSSALDTRLLSRLRACRFPVGALNRAESDRVKD